jgi:hypothetical protein
VVWINQSQHMVQRWDLVNVVLDIGVEFLDERSHCLLLKKVSAPLGW